MDRVTSEILTDLSVIKPDDASELRSLYASASEKLDLSAIDYLTIRDILELTGYAGIPLAALLLLMFQSLHEGSVCLKLSEESLASRLSPLAGDNACSLARRIVKEIDRCPELIHSFDGHSPGLFDDPASQFKPLILNKTDSGSFLYFQKYYLYEKKLADNLGRLLNHPPSGRIDRARIGDALKAVLDLDPIHVSGNKAEFNREQTLAIALPLLKNLVIISGGPGTGKTFIVLNLLRSCVRLGIPPGRIRVAAPTGRAAQRLTAFIRSGIATLKSCDDPDVNIQSITGTTIHRLLNYSPSRDAFAFNRYNKIPADMIIIDEASMVDIIILGSLFEALHDDTVLVLLGDRNQLPSVDAGSVLADLIPDSSISSISKETRILLNEIIPGLVPAHYNDRGSKLTDRVVLLSRSYRSRDDIAEAARSINEQDLSVIDKIPLIKSPDRLPADGLWRIDPGPGDSSNRRANVLDLWIADNYLESDDNKETLMELIRSSAEYDFADPPDDGLQANISSIFSYLDSARILTPVRIGSWGTFALNRYIAERYGGLFDPGGRAGLFSGAPIIITRNHYRMELFNGDIGIILKGKKGRYFGLFPGYGSYKAYPVEALPPHELSYAITIHKSQGSEYGRVLLIIPEGISGQLLSKEILYTGITRAKTLAVIFSSPETLETALRRKIVRESGLHLL